MILYMRCVITMVALTVCGTVLASDLPKGTITNLQILPTTEGDDSIVNAIKYYSNLTGADVNQWKLLWLGDIGTAATVVLSGTGALATGLKGYELAPQYAGRIKDMLQREAGPSQETMAWVTSPGIWALAGALGTGVITYKILYPRILEGVMAKVQQFINVCESLRNAGVNTNFTIVSFMFDDVKSLKSYLPSDWSVSDFALYKGLNNLAYQAKCASTLLNQVGSDNVDIKQKKILVRNYSLCLDHNEQLLERLVTADERKQVELDNLKADTEIKVIGKWALIGSMAKGTVSSLWSGIKELYAHPEILAILGLGWVTTKYFTPSTADTTSITDTAGIKQYFDIKKYLGY